MINITEEHSEDSAKEIFQEFKGDTTLHGFRYVCSNNYHVIRRILWTGIMAGMFAAFTSTLVDSIIKYYSYETYTDQDIKRTYSMSMPAVTMCNNNFIPSSGIAKAYPGLEASMQAFFMEVNGITISENLTKAFAPQYFQSFQNVTFFDFISIAHSIEDIFLECMFDNRKIKCSDYISTTVTTMGTCYTFNSLEFIQKNKQLTVRQPGLRYALSLVIHVHPEDYVLSNSLGIGMQVQIHEPTVQPEIETNNVRVSVGQETFIAIRKNEISTLSKPYSSQDCVAEKKLKDMGKKYHPYLPYSEELCVYDCTYNKLYDCGCDSRTNGTNACSVFQTFTCVRQNYNKFYDGENHCYCPPRCKYNHYLKEISAIRFPNVNGVQLAQGLEWPVNTYEDMNRNLARLNIYYDSMTYTVTQQKPLLEITQVLSNFGGQMGLFTGASIITVFEFADFIIVLVLGKIKNNTGVKQ